MPDNFVSIGLLAERDLEGWGDFWRHVPIARDDMFEGLMAKLYQSPFAGRASMSLGTKRDKAQ